jgi:mono/diheme cytochrome c family protein
VRAPRGRWIAIGCAAVVAAGMGMGRMTTTSNAPTTGGWAAVQPAQAASGPGQAVYGQYCAACHQGGGSGVPGTFPPLTGPVTNGDPHFAARIVLYGLQGRTTVKGQAYSTPMAGLASRMSDAQIADVLTYVRSSFGNSASAVTEDVVKDERAKPGSGADNYSKYPK